MSRPKGCQFLVVLGLGIFTLVVYYTTSLTYSRVTDEVPSSGWIRNTREFGDHVIRTISDVQRPHFKVSGSIDGFESSNDYEYVGSAIQHMKDQLDNQDSVKSTETPTAIQDLGFPDLDSRDRQKSDKENYAKRNDLTKKSGSNVSGPLHNCSFVLDNDLLVRNCITGDLIGRVPSNIQTKSFPRTLHQKPNHGSENRFDRTNSFQKIFKDKVWGYSWDGSTHGLDASGRGATLSWTQEVVATLHSVINDIKCSLRITRVKLLDVPCGDMIWMSRFLQTREDIDYTGVDIVPELIQRHQQTFKNKPNWTFRNLDLVEDPQLGQHHLILCRTLLQHLFDSDAFKVLHAFSRSGSEYLLATTFSQEHLNFDLDLSGNPGRFREINLEIPPYALTPPLCLQRDGPPDDFEGWKHFLGLWKLPLQQVKVCERVKEFKLTETSKIIASCIEWSPYIDLDS